jgi:hypothetical protein
MKVFASAIACVFATVILPALAHAQRAESYTSRYGMLSERNIFLKDRHHATTRPEPSTQLSPRDPERSLRLAGVVVEDDGFRAYVENSAIGTITRLAVGDPIARGKITAIEIDAVAYEANGHTTWIEIGNDFANEPVMVAGETYAASASSAETPTTAPAAAGAPGVANINPNDPNLTVEQRLKLRRQLELKGK